MLKNLLCLVLLFAATNVFAQDTLKFENALTVASGSRYGREAIYTDLLAWQMANGKLQKPKENGDFSVDKTEKKMFGKQLNPMKMVVLGHFPEEQFKVQITHF